MHPALGNAMEGTAVNLKTYQAYSMAEALAAVKRDLGLDAVILNTRSYRRGGFLGLGRRTVVEVTATVAGPTQPTAAPDAAVKPQSQAALRAYLEQRKAAAGNAATASADDRAPDQIDLLKTRRLAQAMLEQHQRRQQETAEALCAEEEQEPGGPVIHGTEVSEQPGESAAATPVNAEEPPDVSIAAADPAAGGPDPAHLPVARRFILTPAHARPAPAVPAQEGRAGRPANGGAAVRKTARRAAAPRRGPVALLEEPPAEVWSNGDRGRSGGDAQEMRDELTAIRSMVGEVLQRQVTSTARGATPTMPQALFDMYLKLIGQDVSEELADRIVNDVRDELSGLELEDESTVRQAVRRHLADYIPTAEQAVPPHSPDDRPLTIALIGPTGVGKTTTLAKLAASFKLRHHRRVGLITADTYRIAAVDQLRTYANIIGLPLKVVLTPGEMRQAVHALADCDVILIDTAGRSQNDAGRLEELEQFLLACDPHETHLVLSSTAGEKVLLREAEAFSALGVDKVVLTKLDEAVSFGVLVSVVRQIGKQLSFLTTGQEVPDHIEAGRPERLAGLVLGEQVHP
jgi:flagellar biosynthesis protein FlhF